MLVIMAGKGAVASTGMVFIQYFMKIRRKIQKLLGREARKYEGIMG
jgi:hypothetical protein